MGAGVHVAEQAVAVEIGRSSGAGFARLAGAIRAGLRRGKSGLQVLRFGQQRRQRRLQSIDHCPVAFIGAAVKFHLLQTSVQRLGHAGALLQYLPGSGEEDRHQYPAGAAHHHRQAFAREREQRG